MSKKLNRSKSLPPLSVVMAQHTLYGGSVDPELEINKFIDTVPSDKLLNLAKLHYKNKDLALCRACDLVVKYFDVTGAGTMDLCMTHGDFVDALLNKAKRMKV